MSKHNKVGRIFGVVNGMPDQGKSYFVKQYLIPKLQADRPVVILDPIGEYAGNQFDDFNHFRNCCLDIGGYPKGVSAIKFDKKETGKYLVQAIRQAETPVCLIVEEAHLLFKWLDTETREKLEEICFMGAHHGFSAILCTQKPKSLSTTVRGAAQFFVSFKQTEPASLEYLRKKSGATGDCREKIASLQQKQFYSIGQSPKGFDEIKINEVNQL